MDYMVMHNVFTQLKYVVIKEWCIKFFRIRVNLKCPNIRDQS